MIDTVTYERYSKAVEKARRLGKSIPETLDEEHLLLTPERSHNLTVTLLEDVLRRLSRQSPNKLMAYSTGKVDGTSAEMFNAVLLWFEAVCRNHANHTLEDL